MLWAQALALGLYVGLGQQVEDDALRVHFTEQALVLEVRSQARQVAEGSSFSNLSGPLSVLRLLESQLADLKGRDTIVELKATQNLTEIRAEAVQLECTADHLLVDLSKVLEASERLALAGNRTTALGDAVRQSRSESSAHAGSGAHSCGERHRLRRRLQQLHEEARSTAAEKEDMERLLGTMQVHVSRIREEAVQGRRALNATRALEALASKDVLEKEHGYQKALEELTHLNEVVHATRRREHRQSDNGTPRNRSEPNVGSGNASRESARDAAERARVVETTPRSRNDTDFGVEKLIQVHLLRAQKPDESFHKGRQDARKTPCHKHKSSLPGHVDGFPAEPDLGSTPEVSADSAEPEEDLPNRAVPGKPDPAIDAAAESIHPEDAQKPTVDLAKGLTCHACGPPLVASTTGPSFPDWYEEADWGELWSEQERLARQLPDLYRRWEAAQNHSRGMLKACLVAEDAERQLRAAVDYHLKAIQLVSVHFNATKAKLLRLRGRARIARDALERLPRCRHAGKRTRPRREDLETKLKEDLRHLFLLGWLIAQGVAAGQHEPNSMLGGIWWYQRDAALVHAATTGSQGRGPEVASVVLKKLTNEWSP
ncbi:unnamed protein product [Symbiodinium necroappetens]|uniref:Uncharacterized protein n=1 Tax=Symbiodinium necroappetens TaxID=1628268 RepID=A0A812P5L4_9DINO|nr:unnamed protein product [Symbiodinium necroappetens]